MAPKYGVPCSSEIQQQYENEVQSYITQRRNTSNWHPALGEAFRNASSQALQEQARLRKTVSCDSLPTATRTLDRIHTYSLESNSKAIQQPSVIHDVFHNAGADLERLQDAMKKYEVEVPVHLRINIDITSKHTWKEVMQAVEIVRDERCEPKGFCDKFRRRCGDLLTKNATAVLTWTEILPSQNEYLSPICGSLKLIFGAAARLRRIREDICLALAEIPYVLDQANNKLNMFEEHNLQDNSPLFQCGNNLMCSVLVTLNCIVREMTKSALKTIGTSLRKQDTYSQKLASALSVMDANAKKLAAAAEDSLAAAMLDTHEKVDMIQSKQVVETNLAKKMNRKLDSILSAARNLEAETLQKEVVEAALKDLFPRFLESAERIDFRTGRVRESEENAKRSRQQLKEGILSSVLKYDAAVVERDTQKKRFAGALDSAAQDRAVAILKDPGLKDFMSKPHSSVLFANANCSPDSSPTAYVSATLASSIKQPSREDIATGQKMCALTFFCASHTDQFDTQAGSCGLMRSFVSQLLAYYPFSLTCLHLAREVDCEDIEDLCNLFGTLINEMPPSIVVFCVVDGITVFETRKAYRKDVSVLIASLVGLTRERQQGPVLKLWMSAFSNSRNLHGLLENEETISLPLKVPQTGGLPGSRLSVGRRDALPR